MKTSTPELRALLASRQFWVADLFTFTTVDGTVLRYSSGDRDVTAGGHLFSCGGVTGPFIEREGERALCRWSRGLEVSTMQFDVVPGSAQINGVPFLSACRNGVFDGAELQLDRAFMPTYGDTSTGTVILFVGRVAEVDAGRSRATFQIADHLELLNQPIPRNIFQPGCVNTLYDASCGLSKASFTVSGTLTSGSTVTSLNASLAAATGYYDLGVVTFTVGPNAGVSRTVKSYTNGGAIRLMTPLPIPPETGDGFTIYPGCDKTVSTCQSKFSNKPNFRGFPYIPQPESAV